MWKTLERGGDGSGAHRQDGRQNLAKTLARIRAQVTLGSMPNTATVRCSSMARNAVSHDANDTCTESDSSGKDSRTVKGARIQEHAEKVLCVIRGRGTASHSSRKKEDALLADSTKLRRRAALVVARGC
jgi:hypothetical protein